MKPILEALSRWNPPAPAAVRSVVVDADPDGTYTVMIGLDRPRSRSATAEYVVAERALIGLDLRALTMAFTEAAMSALSAADVAAVAPHPEAGPKHEPQRPHRKHATA